MTHHRLSSMVSNDLEKNWEKILFWDMFWCLTAGNMIRAVNKIKFISGSYICLDLAIHVKKYRFYLIRQYLCNEVKSLKTCKQLAAAHV